MKFWQLSARSPNGDERLGDRNWAEPVTAHAGLIPGSFGLWCGASGSKAKTQVICSFNQAAVLMVLISSEVMIIGQM